MDIEINKLSENKIQEIGIRKWPIWTKEVSRFEKIYDTREMCYFLEGKVTIETENESYFIGKGDFVIFPKGFKCTWDIQEPVEKHYTFD